MDFVQNRSDPPSSPPDFWIRWKFWDTFPKVKIFGTFATLLGILIHPIFWQKSVPKTFEFGQTPHPFYKKFQKVSQIFWFALEPPPPLMDEVQIKAAFIFEKLPKLVNIVPREFEGQKPSGPQASICEISMELHCNLKNHES